MTNADVDIVLNKWRLFKPQIRLNPFRPDKHMSDYSARDAAVAQRVLLGTSTTAVTADPPSCGGSGPTAQVGIQSTSIIHHPTSNVQHPTSIHRPSFNTYQSTIDQTSVIKHRTKAKPLASRKKPRLSGCSMS
jgi:hypothetical protein